MSNSIENNSIEEIISEKKWSDADVITSKLISISANGWVTKHTAHASEVIVNSGLANWTSPETVTSVYFHSSKSGQIDVSLRCKVPSGKSRLQISIGSSAIKVDVSGDHFQDVKVGNYSIQHLGYVKLDLQGVTKTGNYFADVSHLVLSGDLVESESISFIPEEPHDDIYWSRRGPSVHLDYHLPITEECEYYYNELTVPEGFDPNGSYFMAIGFAFGYFGIQVRSNTERIVLFSVWSPQKTDNPKELAADLKVGLVAKGNDVVVKEFGGEGSGSQSLLRYMWRSGITYKFLVEGKPDSHDSTHSIFTAWFAEHNSDWKLIASFRRPLTHKYLTGFYSFVENFEPDFGYLSRKGLFGNQWICDISGKWHEVMSVRFTGDATATKNLRLDFEGGVEPMATTSHQQFYLKHCGFIDSNVKLLSEFKRTESKISPQINFKLLPINSN